MSMKQIYDKNNEIVIFTNFKLKCFEHENRFITSGPGYEFEIKSANEC